MCQFCQLVEKDVNIDDTLLTSTDNMRVGLTVDVDVKHQIWPEWVHNIFLEIGFMFLPYTYLFLSLKGHNVPQRLNTLNNIAEKVICGSTGSWNNFFFNGLSCLQHEFIWEMLLVSQGENDLIEAFKHHPTVVNLYSIRDMNIELHTVVSCSGLMWEMWRNWAVDKQYESDSSLLRM